jgi:hypothetical protein
MDDSESRGGAGVFMTRYSSRARYRIHSGRAASRPWPESGGHVTDQPGAFAGLNELRDTST